MCHYSGGILIKSVKNDTLFTKNYAFLIIFILNDEPGMSKYMKLSYNRVTKFVSLMTNQLQHPFFKINNTLFFEYGS